MTVEIRPCASTEELRVALGPISHYFGFVNSAEDAERFAGWMSPERMHQAIADGTVIGGAGVFPFDISVPGGSVPGAGVTVVAVLPSHRRRGALTALMRAQLDDIRERGEHLAVLWASEGMIYPRYGYGLATLGAKLTLARERTQFALPFEPRGSVRLVDADDAARLFPPLHEQMFRQRAGFVARTGTWWTTRRLYDDPARRHGGPKTLALLELDGEPAGYAIYSVAQDWDEGVTKGTVTVTEALAPTPEGTRELWRWLLDFDWTSQFVADLLPIDHELLLLLAEPRRLRLRVGDGIWARLVDVAGALSARTFGEGEIVLDVLDPFLPENAGRYRVSAERVERTQAAPELRLDVSALGSVYLGGFRFAQLARAFRVEELEPGALTRADVLFGTERAPWCPEIF